MLFASFRLSALISCVLANVSRRLLGCRLGCHLGRASLEHVQRGGDCGRNGEVLVAQTRITQPPAKKQDQALDQIAPAKYARVSVVEGALSDSAYETADDDRAGK